MPQHVTLGNFWLAHHQHPCFYDWADHMQCLGHFGPVAFGKLVCATEVAVGMEQPPGMWGTRQEKMLQLCHVNGNKM